MVSLRRLLLFRSARVEMNFEKSLKSIVFTVFRDMRDVGEECKSKTRVTGNSQQVDLGALQIGCPIEGRSERRTKGRKGAHIKMGTKM